MFAAVDPLIKQSVLSFYQEQGGTPAEEVRKPIPKWVQSNLYSPNAISDFGRDCWYRRSTTLDAGYEMRAGNSGQITEREA
jgi:hypothetical protein